MDQQLLKDTIRALLRIQDAQDGLFLDPLSAQAESRLVNAIDDSRLLTEDLIAELEKQEQPK
jgi:hypothetical protein